MRDVVRTCMYLFLFSLFQIHYILYIGLVVILTYIVLIFDFHIYIYILMYVLSPISPCVVSFLSLYTCFLFLVYNSLFLFYTKMP